MTASRRPRAPIAFMVGLRPSQHGGDGAALPVPAVDVVEHPHGWRLVFEVAGADPKRLSVEVKGRYVTVRGDRLPTEGETGRFLCVERAVGPFERTIELPEEPDPENGQASYADGLLRLDLGRRTAQRGREIHIRRGSARPGGEGE